MTHISEITLLGLVASVFMWISHQRKLAIRPQSVKKTGGTRYVNSI